MISSKLRYHKPDTTAGTQDFAFMTVAAFLWTATWIVMLHMPGL